MNTFDKLAYFEVNKSVIVNNLNQTSGSKPLNSLRNSINKGSIKSRSPKRETASNVSFNYT